MSKRPARYKRVGKSGGLGLFSFGRPERQRSRLTTTLRVNIRPSADLLAARSVRAFGWNAAGGLARSGTGLLIGIVLARLLGPGPFGEVALALLVIGLANLLVEAGLASALVQKAEVSKEDIRHVFTLQMILGATFTLVLVLLSPLIATAFGQPTGQPVLRALSLMLLLQAAGQPSTALLKRELKFKEIQRVRIVSYLTGYLVVGIPMALAGLAVWSLVGAQLTQTTLNSLWLLGITRHPMRPLLRPVDKLFDFGARVVGANCLNWAYQNLDGLFVSRAFGSLGLGLYNRSMFIANTPYSLLVASAQPVLFSSVSRLQRDHESVRKAYLSTLTVTAVVLLPVFLAGAAAHESVVLGILGDQWAEAVPLVAPFCLAMAIHSLSSIAGPVLWALGHPGVELRCSAWVTGLSAPLFFAASTVSIEAMAWSVVLSRGLFFAFVTSALSSQVQLGWHQLGQVLWRAVTLSFVTMVLISMSEMVLTAWSLSGLERLMVESVLVLVVVAPVLRGHLWTRENLRLAGIRPARCDQ